MDPEQNDKKHVDQTSIRSFPDNWVFHFFVLKTQYLLLGLSGATSPLLCRPYPHLFLAQDCWWFFQAPYTLCRRQNKGRREPREQVERHLIDAAPGNIREAIVNDGRHNIHVFAEYWHGVDDKCCTSLEAWQVFNGVEIEVGKREVHNLLRFSAKLWTLWRLRKDANLGVNDLLDINIISF